MQLKERTSATTHGSTRIVVGAIAALVFVALLAAGAFAFFGWEPAPPPTTSYVPQYDEGGCLIDPGDAFAEFHQGCDL